MVHTQRSRNCVLSALLSVLTLFILVSQTFGSDTVRDSDLFYGSFERGAVAADHAAASSAGAHMLAMGGNAVDAAVAASFTLSVVRPYSCGIGGGGFMVIHLPDDPTHGYVHTSINYRETSPFNADVPANGVSMKNGRYSVAVPGTVAGLLMALEKYGTLSREQVLAPAIQAAHDGFVVDDHYMGAVSNMMEMYLKNPNLQTGYMGLAWEKFALWGHVKLGDRIRNPEQGAALELIARDGLDAFTTGAIGQAIVKSIAPDQVTKRRPATFSVEDLRSYEPIELAPIETDIQGFRLIGMPPPSSGGVTMFQTLEILEAKGYDFSISEISNTRTFWLVEALKHAFADRSRYLADPSFVHVPIDEMLEPQNIQRLSDAIVNDGRRQDPSYYGTQDIPTHAPLEDDDGTSHVSVIDPFGGAVSMTETINHEFGSRVGVREFGFMLNNEMDDFTNPRKKSNGFGLVQSDRNLPEVGKRPLSSMSPTIVLDQDGKVVAIAGASGGPRIITGTMQVLMNVMGGMDAAPAVARPRLHHQWLPNEMLFETGYNMIIVNVFSNFQRGYGQIVGGVDAVVGNVQLIMRDPDGQGWQAASDPRKGGRPSGLD
ncbi:MAG: gamma-glutamyltransferase [Phycisphaerales bacterium]